MLRVPKEQFPLHQPTLNQFGRDLTEMAREAKFDPVVGQDKEIERVIQILSRRTKTIPALSVNRVSVQDRHCGRIGPKIVRGNILRL